MTGHARSAAIRPVPPRTRPQGIFFSDVRGEIQALIEEATDCVCIVIRDEPSPASIITAFPIAC